MATESFVKIQGALFTGFGGRSFLKTWFGTNDFGTLEISSKQLRIASWFLPTYELKKELIEKMVFREHRLPRGPRFAWLRILHNFAELKSALTNAVMFWS